MARPAVERSAFALTLLVLAALGVLSATIEAFWVPQRVGGVVGISILLALVGNVAFGSLGGIGTRRTLGALAPTVAWFVTIGVLTTLGPGGDVILPGKLPQDTAVVHVSSAFLVVGVLAGAIALVICSRFTKRVSAPTPTE